MSRTKRSVASKERRKKVLKQAKGARGGRSKLYITALETVRRALQYNYRDRKKKKSEFRKLWITRISAACKQRDISYSRFIGGLEKAGIKINRKILADIAVKDPEVFDAIVNAAKETLGQKQTI